MIAVSRHAWTVTPGGNTAGAIVHHAAPRFTACWLTGDDDLASVTGPCWSDPGSGDGQDSIHLYGFQWEDNPPSQTVFERLMSQAVTVIDQWIKDRM